MNEYTPPFQMTEEIKVPSAGDGLWFMRIRKYITMRCRRQIIWGSQLFFVEFMLEIIRDALREIETQNMQMYWQAHLELHPDKHKEFWRS